MTGPLTAVEVQLLSRTQHAGYGSYVVHVPATAPVPELLAATNLVDLGYLTRFARNELGTWYGLTRLGETYIDSTWPHRKRG